MTELFGCELCQSLGDIYEEEHLDDEGFEPRLVTLCQGCVEGYAQRITMEHGVTSLENVSIPPWADK